MGDAIEVDGAEGINLGGHLQRVEIFPVVGKFHRERSARSVGRVAFGPGEIFFGEIYDFKTARGLQDGGEERDVAADIGDRDGR